jgi:hypothetical protein
MLEMELLKEIADLEETGETLFEVEDRIVVGVGEELGSRMSINYMEVIVRM